MNKMQMSMVCAWFKKLPRNMQWCLVLFLVGVILLFGNSIASKGREAQNPASPTQEEILILQKQIKEELENAQQYGKLHVMQIEVKTSSYGINKVMKMDINPLERGVVYNNKVDIEVDLTKAKYAWFKRPDGIKLVVNLPQPEINIDTLNPALRGERIEVQDGDELRSDKAVTQLLDCLRKNAKEDLRETLRFFDFLEEAKQQAKLVLTQFYKRFGMRYVEIKFPETLPNILDDMKAQNL